MQSDALDSLTDLLARPEGTWTLAEGALALARLAHPDLDPTPVLEALDALGQRGREAVGRARHPRFAAAGLARLLFEEEAFSVVRAGEETFDALRLDCLLERRAGTPGLLALLFAEIARRAGFRFEPIALPGMSLLRTDHAGAPFLLDPSRGGLPLSVDDVKRMVADASGGTAEFREGWLRPLSREQVLARLLGHAKALLWRGGDHERALVAIRLLLAIRPDDPREIRDSGRLLFLLGRYREAIMAFESYLQHNPHGEDAEAVRRLMLEARSGLSS